MVDLEFHDHGSIWLMAPMTEAGEQWVADNISKDRTEWCATIVIEPRYVVDIILGAKYDGLKIRRC